MQTPSLGTAEPHRDYEEKLGVWNNSTGLEVCAASPHLGRQPSQVGILLSRGLESQAGGFSAGPHALSPRRPQSQGACFWGSSFQPAHLMASRGQLSSGPSPLALASWFEGDPEANPEERPDQLPMGERVPGDPGNIPGSPTYWHELSDHPLGLVQAKPAEP